MVVDKPFVTTSAHGEELITRASDGGVQLTVFQNRRWDADFLTLRKLVREGALGEVRTFESRFEWWRPEGFGNWRDTAALAEGGGILHDLGAHLIDQAIQLFGPVAESYGETANHGPRPDGADTEAFVSLLHESGVRSRLWMNGMAAQVGPALPRPRLRGRLHQVGPGQPGTRPRGRHAAVGSCLRRGPPGLLGGPGRRRRHGARTRRDGRVSRGSMRELAAALRGEGPLPVDPAESLEVLRIIEKIHAFA